MRFPAPNQALAGDPFSVAVVSSDLPEMNGLTLAKIAKAEPLLNATRFIVAAAAQNFPMKRKSQQRELPRGSSDRQTIAVVRGLGKDDWKNRRANLRQKRVAIDRCDSRAPNAALAQNLQIVRAGPFGGALQGAIQPLQDLG
jgi:hypothetical protein